MKKINFFYSRRMSINELTIFDNGKRLFPDCKFIIDPYGSSERFFCLTPDIEKPFKLYFRNGKYYFGGVLIGKIIGVDDHLSFGDLILSNPRKNILYLEKYFFSSDYRANFRSRVMMEVNSFLRKNNILEMENCTSSRDREICLDIYRGGEEIYIHFGCYNIPIHHRSSIKEVRIKNLMSTSILSRKILGGIMCFGIYNLGKDRAASGKELKFFSENSEIYYFISEMKEKNKYFSFVGNIISKTKFVDEEPLRKHTFRKRK